MLKLPPVELPAPSPAKNARTGSLAVRGAISLALLVGIFVVAALVILLLIFANIGLWQLGRVSTALVVATLLVFVGVWKALLAMIRSPKEPVDEVEVPRADEPEMYAMVERIAAQVGTRPPDRIVLVSEVNAYVREAGPFMGLVRGTRTLAIGSPLLDILTVSQLRSILGHELGHFAGGDTKLGPLAFRTDQALRRMLESLSGSIASIFFVWYWKFQMRVNAALSRAQEVAADRASVAIAGRQTAADALQAISVAGRAQALLRGSYIAPLVNAGCRPVNVASGFHSLVGNEARVAEITAAVGQAEERGHVWDSHPPIPERIRRVAALPDSVEVEIDGRAARVLMANPDRWIAAADTRWLDLATRSAQLRTVEWDEWGDVVVAGAQRERAEAVDAALAELGFGAGFNGLRNALMDGHDREVAAALARAGWRSNGAATERDVLLRTALMAVASRSAVDEHGARYTLSWGGPVGLVDAAGETVDLVKPVNVALGGDWAELESVVGASKRRRTRKAAAKSMPVAVPVGDAPAWTLPRPPRPPFEGTDDGFRVELPGRVMGSKSVIDLTTEFISLGKELVSYDDIAAVTLGIKTGSQNGVGATVAIRVSNGNVVKVTPRATRNNANLIAQTLGYLWDLLSDRVGPRLRAQAVADVRAGKTVAIGDFMLSAQGVATRKKPADVHAWSEVANAKATGTFVFIPVVKGKPLRTTMSGENVFVLEPLVSELRALYG